MDSIPEEWIHMDGCWSPEQTQWIHEFIRGIPTYIRSHPDALVGDIDAAPIGKPGYQCYVVKGSPSYAYRLYFQPYRLEDREPICGIEVTHREATPDVFRFVVHPMNMSAVYTPPVTFFS